MKTQYGSSSRLLVVITILCLLITSCSMPVTASTSGTLRTWVDQPRTGSVIPLAPMPIKVSVSGSGGEGWVDVLVNGVKISTIPTAPGLAQLETNWNPSAAGLYTIQSRAYDKAGNSMLSGITEVCVTDAAGQSTQNCPSAAQDDKNTPAIEISPTVETAQPQNPVPGSAIEIKTGASPNPANYGKCDTQSTLINFEAYPADDSGAVEVTLFVSLQDAAGGRHELGMFALMPAGGGAYNLKLDTNELDTSSLGYSAGLLLYTVQMMNASKEFYASSSEASIGLQPCLADQPIIPTKVIATLPVPPVVVTPVPLPVITSTVPPAAPQKPTGHASANTVYYVTGCGENTLTVTAQVSNPSRVSAVIVHWLYSGGSNNPGTEKIFPMNPLGGGSYSLEIMDPKLHTAYPNLNGGNGTIQYWIEAQYGAGSRIYSDVNYVEVLFCPG